MAKKIPGEGTRKLNFGWKGVQKSFADFPSPYFLNGIVLTTTLARHGRYISHGSMMRCLENPDLQGGMWVGQFVYWS